MSGPDALLVVLLAAAGGGLASLAVHRSISLAHRRAHHEIGSVVFLQLGVIFAVLLAFVFDETWTQYNTAGEAIDYECGALHGASMIASTLTRPEARRVLADESAYVASVVGAEWPEMARHRREDLATDNLLVALVQDVGTVLRGGGTDQAGAREILSLLATAHAQREARIFQIGSGIPVALWLVLLVYTFVLVLFVAFAGLQWPATAISFTALFAAGIASILVVAHLLDYPFEGALAISPGDFSDLLAKLRLLLAAAGGGAPGGA